MPKLGYYLHMTTQWRAISSGDMETKFNNFTLCLSELRTFRIIIHLSVILDVRLLSVRENCPLFKIPFPGSSGTGHSNKNI